MIRVLRVPLTTCLAVFLAFGAVASYRAYSPVSSVRIVLAEPTIRGGTGIQVDTVASGRGPVTIQIDLVQAGRSETVAIDRVSSKHWAFWDFRQVRHSTHAVVSGRLLERFAAGPAVVRATVVGARAWLRQPPPVVEEVPAHAQPGPGGR